MKKVRSVSSGIARMMTQYVTAMSLTVKQFTMRDRRATPSTVKQFKYVTEGLNLVGYNFNLPCISEESKIVNQMK